MESGIISKIKTSLFPKGRNLRRVPFGLYKGLNFWIDFSSDTQLYFGLWERETHSFIKHALSVARWVIDVGAGRGELICLSARRTKILKIVAVEPLTAMYDLIVEHLRINGLLNDPRISILTKYVSSVPNKNIDTVLLDSIDVPVGEHGFLKIDVDGAEMDVLMSGQQLLKKWPVDVLVETHSQVLEKSCADFLKKLGYKVELIKNAWWRFILPEQRPIEHNRWLCGYK